jgi:hypothetical protein
MAKQTSCRFKAGAGLLLLFVSASLDAQTGAASPDSAKQFQVCSGYFALCTTATCSKQGNSYACGDCKVESGYSAGLSSVACSSIPKVKPTTGQELSSRYSPIRSYVACENDRPWAMCLDSLCKMNSDGKTATCTCSISHGQPYVYTTSSSSSKGCDGSEVISSVTVSGLQTMTDFLKKSKSLPALPIKVLPAPVH